MATEPLNEATIRYSSNGNSFKLRINGVLQVDGEDGNGVVKLFSANDVRLQEYLKLAKQHGGSEAEVKKPFVLKGRGGNTLELELSKASGKPFVLRILSRDGEAALVKIMRSTPGSLEENQIELGSDIFYRKIKSDVKKHVFHF